MNDYVMDIFSIINKTVLVTGASKGIGEAISLGCQAAGANIVCLARSPRPNSSKLANSYIQCDIEDSLIYEEIIKDVIKKFGSIDSLINVAAISLPPNQENEHERFSKTLNVNLNAVFKCCDITSRFMSFGGSILNISSIGGIQGFPNNPGYVASKGGLRMLTKALAIDLKEKGIRVNCLMPGYIKTDMTKASYDNLRTRSRRLDRMIIKRWGKPEDLVGAAIFFVSNASSYITGTDLIIDGGWTAKGL